MKSFSKIYESITGASKTGNDLTKTGVSNHYTPIENILTNINNLFCTRLSIAAMKGEDNVSIKLSSSRFTSEQAIDELLMVNLYNDVFSKASLYNYIVSQGLTKMTKVNLGGGYWIVYFSPTDIKGAKVPTSQTVAMPTEAIESFNYEFEYSTIIKEDDGEEEMKSQTLEKVLELLDGPDKVKAAKQLELLVSNEISLPREYYFSAVKFKSGEEAIALRWKYTKKMPFGKAEKDGEYKEVSVENTRSLMHIFGKGEKAIWVQDFDEDSLVELPEEVKKLIESILDLLEAGKTDNPSVFSLTGERKERDENKDEDENKDKDYKKDNKNEGEEDDNESDDDRGDDSDNL